MAKAFSVASWNVEHFKDDPTGARITRWSISWPAPTAGRRPGSAA